MHCIRGSVVPCTTQLKYPLDKFTFGKGVKRHGGKAVHIIRPEKGMEFKAGQEFRWMRHISSCLLSNSVFCPEFGNS